MQPIAEAGISSLVSAVRQLIRELESGIAAIGRNDVNALEAAIARQEGACMQLQAIYVERDWSKGDIDEAVISAVADLRKVSRIYRSVLKQAAKTVQAIISLCEFHADEGVGSSGASNISVRA